MTEAEIDLKEAEIALREAQRHLGRLTELQSLVAGSVSGEEMELATDDVEKKALEVERCKLKTERSPK